MRKEGEPIVSKIVTASEVMAKIKSNATIAIGGSGHGHALPEKLIEALAEHYQKTGNPKNLSLLYTLCMGDTKDKGANQLAIEGLVKRVVAGHWQLTPKLGQMVNDNKIEGYNLPSGAISQLYRAIAGAKPGVITKVGLDTYVDPRLEGGKLNDITKEDLVKLVELEGEEWLLYKSFPIDVAFIRGTTADEDGNITMEEEPVLAENLSIAQAAHNSGGFVVAQVKRVCKRGTLPPKQVKVPGIIVDAIVVAPDEPQLYTVFYNPAYAGEIRIPVELQTLPMDEKKVIKRRALKEMRPGDITNVGVGIAAGLGEVAEEENVSDLLNYTIEQGLIGGIPASGPDFGTGINYDAIINGDYQFDFYDGGGLDIAFLSFAEVDQDANVNVTRFGDIPTGCGGFINISQNSKRVMFLGTLTGGGRDIRIEDGQVAIKQEGKYKKFVKKVRQVSFSAKRAIALGQQVTYLTERAVFELTKEGLMLTEIAPGVDLEKDVLQQMEFKPLIAPNLKIMDSRLFKDAPMNIRAEILAKQT
ncbi:MAG: acyl CoA:acetate/3-ketoacid CoA transferase [Oscillibacter sp.]|nr:acyl CoA:acetate/3-ketoacid CoA transferase [Oscillibacter sp.]